MKIRNHRFWICLIGTLILTAGVIFLPRHISRSLDLRTLNQVEVSRREDFSFLEQGSNQIYDVIHAFSYLGQEGNPVLITSVEEPIQINSELLEKIYIQAMIASELGILPWLGPPVYTNASFTNEYIETEYGWADWTSYPKSAQYYSLTFASDENPNKTELLNFWYLRFTDETSFDYSFIVNAVNYQIYYAEIHNAATQRVVKNAETVEIYGLSSHEMDVIFGDEAFAAGCMEYYQALGYDCVTQENLYQKLSLAILYYEEKTPVYIERAIIAGDGSSQYDGICIGFQDMIRWVRQQQKE